MARLRPSKELASVVSVGVKSGVVLAPPMRQAIHARLPETDSGIQAAESMHGFSHATTPEQPTLIYRKYLSIVQQHASTSPAGAGIL